MTEREDPLRHSVLEYLKVALGNVRNRLAVLGDDGDVYLNDVGVGGEQGCILGDLLAGSPFDRRQLFGVGRDNMILPLQRRT